MCGIVGAVAERSVQKILIEGLRRLEYRGYDSAGITVIDQQQNFKSSTRIRQSQRIRESFSFFNITWQWGHCSHPLGHPWCSI